MAKGKELVIFSRRLKSALYARGMNGKQLALAIGVSQPTVSHYVTGQEYPRLISLPAICQALNVSADYLLGLSNKMEV